MILPSLWKPRSRYELKLGDKASSANHKAENDLTLFLLTVSVEVDTKKTFHVRRNMSTGLYIETSVASSLSVTPRR